MLFYTGTHKPHWLYRSAVPWFVSAVQLRKQRTWKRAAGPWALDSGAFSEVAAHGRHTTAPRTYADDVRRWRDQLGNLQWAAIQEWTSRRAVARLLTSIASSSISAAFAGSRFAPTTKRPTARLSNGTSGSTRTR